MRNGKSRSMIVAENLSKHYGNIQAVREISFEVGRGEIMVLLGTSGCGKTTTLKMLNRLIEPSAGTIFIDGHEIRSRDVHDLRRSIGYVSQNNGLFPHYTVAENVGIVPQLLGWDAKRIADDTGQWLERLKLPLNAFGAKYPDELSGGQKQRVALARALIASPPVLLMDEPFGALDPVTRLSIRDEFKSLQQQDQRTIVLVTHDIQEAFALGDRICLMDQGKIIQTGTAKALMFDPASKFVSSFFGHQRYMLELSALTFNDIWDDLQQTTGTADLNARHSLWDAMELLSGKNNERIVISNQENQSKFASIEDIQHVYQRIKNPL